MIFVQSTWNYSVFQHMEHVLNRTHETTNINLQTNWYPRHLKHMIISIIYNKSIIKHSNYVVGIISQPLDFDNNLRIPITQEQKFLQWIMDIKH